MNNYELNHGIITERFGSIQEMQSKVAQTDGYQITWAYLHDEILKGCDSVTSAKFQGFAPSVQYVYIDTDFLIFSVDLKNGTIELHRSGYHARLTDEDKKKSYLCLANLYTIAKATGAKWFRKSRFKDAGDLVAKINRFYGSMREMVDQVTDDGKMKINIY